MPKPLLRALFLCLTTTIPAAAQTAVGTGVGIASSRSQSGAVAISGQGGQGGSSNSNLTVNSAAVPAVTTANINQSGTQTLRNVPTVFAPGLSAAGLETCLGSVSGGVGWVGFGVTGGGSIQDERCAARLDSRTLWAMGLKGAAIARLCIEPSGMMYRSMPDVCARYMPVGSQGVGPAPVVLATGGAAGATPVVDGRTGVTRSCDDYNAIRQKCLQWTGEPRIKVAARKPAMKPLAAAPGVAAINAAAPVAAKPEPEPKKED